MLMLDRYLVASGRAVDLATGAAVRFHTRAVPARRAPTLLTMRGRCWLIDFDLRKHTRLEVWERADKMNAELDQRTLQAFRSAIADARDGQPRAFDVVEPSADKWQLLQRVLAREARLAGFVPIAADALGAVLAEAHWRWPSWIKDRSLVLFATDTRWSPDASLALFRLATRDARPHLLVRCATSELWRPKLAATVLSIHDSAHQDGAGDGSLVERAEALHQAGKMVEAESVARWSVLLSDDEGPARCALAKSLTGQRRLLEARAALASIDSAEAEAVRASIRTAAGQSRFEPAMVEGLIDILRVCHELDDPSAALSRVADMLRSSMAASVVAFIIADRQHPHSAAHAGAYVPSAAHLRLAAQTLDTGIASPLTGCGPGDETTWPIRYGASIVGAVWVQWAMGAPLTTNDVATLLGLAAAATAPAVHALNERLRAPRGAASAIPDLIGNSPAIEKVRQAVLKAAASPFPVLIEGESGAGKELVARAVHAASLRRSKRFCALNCAALSDELVEAELFGHTRGAFTGAIAERLGLFEESQGGTLFLDEVAELSARVQAKLLRTLQEGEVRRVGESTTRKVDARIVAATNRPLGGEVTAGHFRNDLRYRLDVLRITLPPLRERVDDIPPLVRHIWATLSERTRSRAVLSPSALSLLGAYDWPGNVRELQNVLASVMVSAPQRGVIGPHALPGHISRAAAVASRATLAEARREFEARFVRAALARSGGRAVSAARELGVSRQGLRKLTMRLGLSNLDGRGTH